MNISVIGTGYVGLVSGVCFADLGHKVTCVDKDIQKVMKLRNGEVPIYEPGLQELMVKNAAAGRLSFTHDVPEAVQDAEIIILAVGTPSLPNGEANLQYIEQAAREIALAMNGYKIIMTKSTVPVGTNEHIRSIIASLTELPFDVASVPEFLREGSAISDTFHPDRIVIGTDSETVKEKLTELHSKLANNILITDVRSAEMIKYASNAFLATKISFINEIANICEKVGADVTLVARGMGYDRRIGSAFLSAGIGYGGSCFPKDTDALIQIAGNVEYDFKLLKSVVNVNKDQRFNVIRKLQEALGDLSGKTIAIWGLAFKPNTDDVRYAPAIEIIGELTRLGCTVKAYDPVAMENFRKSGNYENVIWCDAMTSAAADSDALCLLTEWDEFKKADLAYIEKIMNQPVLIDGRNVFTKDKIALTNFHYYSVGRPNINQVSQAIYSDAAV
ncbi:UDP-glucose dehydrogenase family protein [Paenibacillus chartarius]|uniref:UDP-glucose 6-dehydrogenase n=1 Tax=Paenibacillus chartarius TaxID=747481 RepID=A0ABV6DLK6_9BACL